MPSDPKERLQEVAAFLEGSGALDGRWMDDDPPKSESGHTMRYWWRAELREAVAALLAENGALRERCAVLEEAYDLKCGAFDLMRSAAVDWKAKAEAAEAERDALRRDAAR